VKNIIRKQSVRFQYNGKSDGFALQKEVSDWCELTLIPQIEQQLEPFCLLDEYISLDKIEINTEIDGADWQQKIQQEVLFSLRKNLEQYRTSVDVTKGKGLKAAADGSSGKYDGASLPDRTTERLDEKHTVARKTDELFIYFLEKGYLPWWSNAVLIKDFKLALQEWAAENKEDARADAIREQLQLVFSESVVTRILNQLPGKLFFEFFKNIFKKDAAIIGQLQVFLKEVTPNKISGTKQEAIARTVHGFILGELLAGKEEIDLNSLVQFVYAELKQQKAIDLSARSLSAIRTKVSGPAAILWQQLLLQDQKVRGTKKKISDALHTEEIKGKAKYNYNKVIDQLKDRPGEIHKRPDTVDDRVEGIFIDNAGAVLIAAFLPALFEKLKIAKQSDIVDKDMAVFVIQYIVSGKTTISEFELVLPKILCGMELESAVNTDKKITAVQRKEVDEMLSSAIEHWSALKNTSVQGLREAFLQRRGKLIFTHNEWLLQVERKSYDMLLQQLPWSFTMLKLPWMKNLLKTDWI